MNLKNPLFSRKNLLLITSGVLVSYFLLWGGVLINNKIDQENKIRTAKAQQEQIKNLSKEELAIQKAQSYLVDSIALVQPEQRPFLDYLQRKFSLDKALGIAGAPFDLTENPKTYPEEIHFLARIVYPDKLVKAPPKSIVDGPLLTNIYSANCDHLTLPTNYWQTMEQNYAAGGYYMTHDALAFVFMKENNCKIPPDQSNLLPKVAEGMVKLVNNPDTVADLRYEAVTLLQLSGHGSLLKAEWINQILAEQQENGSWSERADDTKGSDHSTVLALWALLEYYRPNTPVQPLIRRPSTQAL